MKKKNAIGGKEVGPVGDGGKIEGGALTINSKIGTQTTKHIKGVGKDESGDFERAIYRSKRRETERKKYS